MRVSILSLESFPLRFLKKREKRESPLGDSAGLSCDRGSVMWYGSDILEEFGEVSGRISGAWPVIYIFCLGLFHVERWWKRDNGVHLSYEGQGWLCG